MNYLIEKQSQLKELEPLLQEVAEKSGVIAVDTEFLREKTYNAKLCLVQLGIDEHQYCIDVLAIEDLGSLVKLFADQRITKLFHAARQDMEVIYQTLGVLPKPIFDTQLAAAFCGSDMQIGYGGLVLDRLDVDLPKTQSRTDWTRRPLSAEQVEYAGDDVAYLEALYDLSVAQMEQEGKREWYEAEIDTYYDIDLYVIDPAVAYKRLAGGNLRIPQQYTLKALAEWRESMAQQRDIPRSWVMRDDKLFDLAVKSPKTEQEVRDLGVFGRKSAQYLASKAAKLISGVDVGETAVWRKVEPLTKQQKGVCSKMMKLVAGYAAEHKIAQGLLGTRKNVEHLYRNRSSKRLLNGWREEVVGKPLLDYLRQEGV